jgi:hypothetical protein
MSPRTDTIPKFTVKKPNGHVKSLLDMVNDSTNIIKVAQNMVNALQVMVEIPSDMVKVSLWAW